MEDMWTKPWDRADWLRESCIVDEEACKIEQNEATHRIKIRAPFGNYEGDLRIALEDKFSLAGVLKCNDGLQSLLTGQIIFDDDSVRLFLGIQNGYARAFIVHACGIPKLHLGGAYSAQTYKEWCILKPIEANGVTSISLLPYR